MKLLEELRRDSGESLSQIFRDALYIYYRLVKAGKKAGVDYRKYFNDIERLAYHIYNVEMRQFVILDREFYRVLLKKLQKIERPEEIVDEEFVNAVKGIARLFLIDYGWNENTSDVEKAEAVLRTIEFAGGGTFVKVNEHEFVFRTPPENLIVTKIIIKTLLESGGIKASFETTSERIFIRVES
ncbi:MAG TPA: hypothetical protein HA299_01715 [Methermicoccus shengliensis]|uniref:Uncharacterized protein n=2 Tax=Methermicoccus shengliensis TaxID=660064 RepID=A0A832RX83_9EURY|nr:hypothetical protein [Methermicoccus shengliensis]